MSSLICICWSKRGIHTNTDYAVTGWMLCVITYICKHFIDNYDDNNRNQVNNVIKFLLHIFRWWIANYSRHVWSDYTDLNNMNGHFGSEKSVWRIKDLHDFNINFWHWKYFTPCTNVLGSVAYIVISKILIIVAAKNSCGDVKTIYSHKISAVIRYLSDKQLIVLYPCLYWIIYIWTDQFWLQP